MNLFTLIILIAISLIIILGAAVGWSLVLTYYSIAVCFAAMAGLSSRGKI